MSLKKNITANFISQFYVAAIGILIVPFYVKLMGAEAYGLVGFYAVMQAWFNLLDLGLSPTLARETARYRGGATDGLTLRRLLRALELIFLSMALGGAFVIGFLSHDLSNNWLKVETLSHDKVAEAILIMGCVLALRWLCALYRAAVTGYENLVWLSSFNIIITSCRFLGVIPALLYLGATPKVFFSYNLVIAVLELLILSAQTYRLMPRNVGPLGWSLKPVSSVLKFSLTLAFTSTVSVAITQTDKLLLSKLISLTDYAYFTLAVLAASSITILGGPIIQAFQPRLARLAAEQDEKSLVQLYRTATQAIAMITGSATIALTVFAQEVLWAWTGDALFSSQFAIVLRLYAIGNGFLALAAFPFYLQFAKGNMRLHLIGNMVFLLVLLPAVVIATRQYGVVGAGSVWAITNFLFFLLWTPLVHARFVPGLHKTWMLHDIVPVLAGPLALGLLLQFLPNLPLGRSGWICFIILASCCMVAVATLSGSFLRALLLRTIQGITRRAR